MSYEIYTNLPEINSFDFGPSAPINTIMSSVIDIPVILI